MKIQQEETERTEMNLKTPFPLLAPVNEKLYQELLKRYVVSIERPEPTEEKRIAEAK